MAPQEKIPSPPPIGLEFAVDDAPPVEVAPEDIGRTISKAAKWREGRKLREDATGLAVMLLAMLDGAAIMALGRDDAARSTMERQFTDEPLQRWLQRADPEALAFVNRYADPILILAGFGMWGTRLYREEVDRRSEKEKPIPGLPTVGGGEAQAQEPENNHRVYQGPPAATPKPESGLIKDEDEL